MKRSIKIPWGERNGEIVHVSQVPSGQACGCVCLSCKSPLVAHKGGKKAHHFKHEADSACAESALHKLGKIFLKRKLDGAIERSEPVPIHWQCEHCDAYHNVPLLASAVRCDLEVPISALHPENSSARADIGIFDASDRLIAAIEIVVTHSPEDSAIAAYRSKEITCIEIELKDERDLEGLEKSPALMASKVNACTMPKCPECRAYLSQRCIHVVDGDCWSCHTSMKIAFGSTSGVMFSPEDFTPLEVESARREGAILRNAYSRTVGHSYLANICPHCASMSGSFFLHDYYHLAEDAEPLRILMHCEKCDTLVANEVGADGVPWRGKLVPNKEEDSSKVEHGVGIQEAMRRMITGTVSRNSPNASATTPNPVVPAVGADELPSGTSAEQISKPASAQQQPQQPQRTRWGRCGRCSKPSCPTIVDEGGAFFCATCRTKTRFIADP